MSGDKSDNDNTSLKSLIGTILGIRDVDAVLQSMPKELRVSLSYALTTFNMARKEHVLALMPYMPQF